MRQEERDFDQWYDTYVNDMFSYGMAFGIEKDILMDAIHDVFLHLYEGGDKLNITTNVKFYLLCSLKNRIISLKRKEIPYKNLEETSEYDFLIKVETLDLLEDEEERQECSKQIEYLMSLLTGKQREVIYLHYMQDLSYEEIARILQITTKSVRKLTYRAIERMQEEKLLLMFIWLVGLIKP